MKIFKDLFTGDEMFTDSYKVKLVDDVLYEVYGKYVTRKQGEIILGGANPSQEDGDDATDESVESGVDIVLNQRLVETPCFPDKKSYLTYLKEYMKKVTERLKETKPDEVDTFKSKMNDAVKKLIARFDDFQFYTGESCDSDGGMVAILEYRQVENEEIPIMIFYKYGLLEEKY